MFRILWSAYKKTKNFITSITGDEVYENMFKNEKSELNKSKWNVLKFLKLLSDTFLIKIPMHCPSWMPYPIKLLFFGDNSKYVPDKDSELGTNGECIIFLNGILYNDTLIEDCRDMLKKSFNKPVNILKNASDSLVSDLIESLIGKTTNELNEASLVALHTISNKLIDSNVKKVILICYSQGTIIAANVLRNLHRLGLDKKEFLEKLEVYAFACCASKMNYLVDELPYMEHFANDNDYVAALGCNHGKDVSDLISIDGKIFIKENKSGHMFNTHYWNNFKNDFPDSKLVNYITN